MPFAIWSLVIVFMLFSAFCAGRAACIPRSPPTHCAEDWVNCRRWREEEKPTTEQSGRRSD